MTRPEKPRQLLEKCLGDLGRVVEYVGALAIHPWRHCYGVVLRTLEDPDQYFDNWMHTQQSSYLFVGLVASVISAVVAQLLNAPQALDSSWVAPAALYFSLCLSLMAVITALVMSEFLSSARFQPSRSAQLKRVFNMESPPVQFNKQAWIGAFLYSTPDVLLSQSIMSAFVGIGVMVVSPLWSRAHGPWDKSEKIACVGVAGLGIGTGAYVMSTVLLYRNFSTSKLS